MDFMHGCIVSPPLGDAWKQGFIEVLKNSPSKDRKFIRWRAIHKYRGTNPVRLLYKVWDSGEMEVFSHTSS
jgi:hypothetical protein